jgi:hypothetical protein
LRALDFGIKLLMAPFAATNGESSGSTPASALAQVLTVGTWNNRLHVAFLWLVQPQRRALNTTASDYEVRPLAAKLLSFSPPWGHPYTVAEVVRPGVYRPEDADGRIFTNARSI